MPLVCFASQKGSPGTTATALAVAAAMPTGGGRRKLLLEADVTGGTLAIRYRLPVEPGLLTLAAEVRGGIDVEGLWRHTQELPGGLRVVVCPDGPDQVNAGLMASGAELGRFLNSLPDVDVICDVGRLAPDSPSLAFVAEASAVLMVARPVAEQLQPAARRMLMLRPQVANLGWVLIGDKPYGPLDVEKTFEFPVVGVIADDARSVTALEAGTMTKRLRRHPFIRSASTLASTLSAWLAPLHARTDPSSSRITRTGEGSEATDGDQVPPDATVRLRPQDSRTVPALDGQPEQAVAEPADAPEQSGTAVVAPAEPVAAPATAAGAEQPPAADPGTADPVDHAAPDPAAAIPDPVEQPAAALATADSEASAASTIPGVEPATPGATPPMPPGAPQTTDVAPPPVGSTPNPEPAAPPMPPAALQNGAAASPPMPPAATRHDGSARLATPPMPPSAAEPDASPMPPSAAETDAPPMPPSAAEPDAPTDSPSSSPIDAPTDSPADSPTGATPPIPAAATPGDVPPMPPATASIEAQGSPPMPPAATRKDGAATPPTPPMPSVALSRLPSAFPHGDDDPEWGDG